MPPHASRGLAPGLFVSLQKKKKKRIGGVCLKTPHMRLLVWGGTTNERHLGLSFTTHAGLTAHDGRLQLEPRLQERLRTTVCAAAHTHHHSSVTADALEMLLTLNNNRGAFKIMHPHSLNF